MEERTFDSSEGEANVTDLLPGTQYTFSVVAVSQFEDRRATSPPSNSDSGTTNVTGMKLPVANLHYDKTLSMQCHW